MEGDYRLLHYIDLVGVISIHSLRMEGDNPKWANVSQKTISIHSLRMEGDENLFAAVCRNDISIHSLRMEGDYRIFYRNTFAFYFNPLPPHGGRLVFKHCVNKI